MWTCFVHDIAQIHLPTSNAIRTTAKGAAEMFQKRLPSFFCLRRFWKQLTCRMAKSTGQKKIVTKVRMVSFDQAGGGMLLFCERACPRALAQQLNRLHQAMLIVASHMECHDFGSNWIFNRFIARDKSLQVRSYVSRTQAPRIASRNQQNAPFQKGPGYRSCCHHLISQFLGRSCHTFGKEFPNPKRNAI